MFWYDFLLGWIATLNGWLRNHEFYVNILLCDACDGVFSCVHGMCV